MKLLSVEADAAFAELTAGCQLGRGRGGGGSHRPADIDEVGTDDLAHAPVFPGLAPQDGQVLSATVLRFLSEVPAEVAAILLSEVSL